MTDISEKRCAEDGQPSRYVPRGPTKSDELTLDAKNFIARNFTQDKTNSTLRSMVRKPTLMKRGTKQINDIIALRPSVICEPLISRAAGIPKFQEPASTIPLLRDEAYRLDGSWMGAMAYLDDEGNPVVFEERAEFIQVGMDIQGVVRSQRVCGLPKHETLEYRVSFSIAKHGYAGGVWSESIAARKYFGVMLGHFEEDSSILAGTWMGTHRNGVRRGFFKWRKPIGTERKSTSNSTSITWRMPLSPHLARTVSAVTTIVVE